MQNTQLNELERFFNQLKDSGLVTEEKQSKENHFEGLAMFFNALRLLLDASPISVEPEKIPESIDTQGLQAFFQALKPKIEQLHQQGAFCNPWVIASLKRDEVRNSAVLAWLLDPQGDHGLGDKLTNALLAYIHQHQAHIPACCTSRVYVKTEVNPMDERSERVDIEIDSEAFYVLLEVKINAGEGDEQLLRYIRACENRAPKRPWTVVFLTRHGRLPKTAGDYNHNVVSLSWKTLERIFIRELNAAKQQDALNDFGTRLAVLFLRHVRNF